jgi:lycopene cyclase CruA
VPAAMERWSREDGALAERLGRGPLEQVQALERSWSARRDPLPVPLRGPDAGAGLDADVLLAGGGLSLIYAVTLARRGLKVAVADPRGAGRSHREWNAATHELEPLVEEGVLSRAQLASAIVNRYRAGLIRWHGGAPIRVQGVLDVAIEGQTMLDLLRRRALEEGVQLLDGEAALGHRGGKGGIAVLLQDAQARRRTFTARLLLDGRGAASPFARWDLVCPTVGGVLEGLAEGSAPDEVDPTLGEILVSTEGASNGTQPIWEGFPAEQRRFTAYLFEYTEPRRLGPRPLTALYHRFFASLPSYKRGEARVVRPTFGFIPAYSRLRPSPTAPDERVLLVGDAAGRHSPLTFCGFGSALRSFGPICGKLLPLLERADLSRRSLARVWSEPRCLSAQGAMTLMMIDRGGLGTAADPQAINRLLDASFQALAEQGEAAARDFLQDKASAATLLQMLRGTAARVPSVYRAALRNLSPYELAAFAARLWSFARSERPKPPAAAALEEVVR